MDTETQMIKLLEEETYLNELLDSLKKLKARKGYDNCTKDISNLITKLKAKKANVTSTINEISDEIVSATECFANADNSTIDDFI